MGQHINKSFVLHCYSDFTSRVAVWIHSALPKLTAQTSPPALLCSVSQSSLECTTSISSGGNCSDMGPDCSWQPPKALCMSARITISLHRPSPTAVYCLVKWPFLNHLHISKHAGRAGFFHCTSFYEISFLISHPLVLIIQVSDSLSRAASVSPKSSAACQEITGKQIFRPHLTEVLNDTCFY